MPETMGEMTATTPEKAEPKLPAKACTAGSDSSKATAMDCKTGVKASLMGSPSLAATRLIFSSIVPQLPAEVLESWEDRL